MPRLRFRLIPRDEGFFELFVRQADQIVASAELLEEMLSSFQDVPAKARRLHDMEHEGDEITHDIMKRLNTTFVTPIDHEDIHQLASQLADLLVLHKIEEPLPEMKAQADVIVRGARSIREALRQLPRYDRLPEHWVEVNRLENEGDRIYRQAVADLFSGDYRAMDVLKWKGVLDELEAATDQLEDVANTLESLALKHA